MKFTGERLVPDVAGYDDLFYEHVSRYIFASLLVEDASVLDAGCGCGYGTYRLSQSGAAAVIGIDVAQEAIDYCRQSYIADNLRFEARDVMTTGFADASFDVIVSFEVFEHLADADGFLREMRRTLKPEGIFCLSTPNALTYVAGTEDGKNPFHVCEYTPNEFRELLTRYFDSVILYAQSSTTGLSLVPATEDCGEMVESHIAAEARQLDPPQDSSWGRARPAQCSLEGCQYMLAVAGGGQLRIESLPNAQIFTFSRDLGTGSDLLKQKNNAIIAQQKAYDARTAWALDLKAELDKRDQTIRELQDALERQQQWALSLKEQLDKELKAK